MLLRRPCPLPLCSRDSSLLPSARPLGQALPVWHAPLYWPRLEPAREPRTSVHSIPVQGPGSTETAAPADPLQGQVSEQLMDRMRQSITQALDAEDVRVVDINGDGRHVGIEVVASAFEGLNSMKRQRLVYKSIWQELQETVHAVDSMSTRTPAEAGR